MGRPKEFDAEEALDAAVAVFGEHGFAATSAAMLTRAMRIGRQSLYDTYGDKWHLYVGAVRRYGMAETAAHLRVLREAPNVRIGVERMLERVIIDARTPCLGVGSISEFGTSAADLVAVRKMAADRLEGGIRNAFEHAAITGSPVPLIAAEDAAAYLVAVIAGLRMAARGGADEDRLRTIARLALRGFD